MINVTKTCDQTKDRVDTACVVCVLCGVCICVSVCKKRLKGAAGRIPRSRIGSALVCVRRNAQPTPILLLTVLSWLLYPPVGPLVV